ncbi:MATE family efflux transporter, partial [Erwinia amylovora]|nr:MATE family efflux transporter [Erwinia amylovora]
VYLVKINEIRDFTNRAKSILDNHLTQRISAPDRKAIGRLTGLGLPVALALLFDVTRFAVGAWVVSPVGLVAVAGQQFGVSCG